MATWRILSCLQAGWHWASLSLGFCCMWFCQNGLPMLLDLTSAEIPRISRKAQPLGGLSNETQSETGNSLQDLRIFTPPAQFRLTHVQHDFTQSPSIRLSDPKA
mmetsp:Transcript_53429/g.125341  ORF Transcript_53429/g.125341 Transcript_53429/m.125341 type:complete len:104 (-) Transcript_53429:24-335(-)